MLTAVVAQVFLGVVGVHLVAPFVDRQPLGHRVVEGHPFEDDLGTQRRQPVDDRGQRQIRADDEVVDHGQHQDEVGRSPALERQALGAPPAQPR